MKPFITEKHFDEGKHIGASLISTLAQKTDPLSALTGLVFALILTADAAGVPLESVFQMCRELRRELAKAQKALEENPPEPPSGLVDPSGAPLVK